MSVNNYAVNFREIPLTFLQSHDNSLMQYHVIGDTVNFREIPYTFLLLWDGSLMSYNLTVYWYTVVFLSIWKHVSVSYFYCSTLYHRDETMRTIFFQIHKIQFIDFSFTRPIQSHTSTHKSGCVLLTNQYVKNHKIHVVFTWTCQLWSYTDTNVVGVLKRTHYMNIKWIGTSR